MTPALLAISLAVVGIIALIAELLLPTHGAMGVVGFTLILGAIVVCFFIDVWLGTGVAAVGVLASPFIGAWLVRIWPRTPVGRKLLLAPPIETVEPPPVQPGAIGTAVSELRPSGECEFGDQRLEAFSDRGVIPAGAKVKVVNVVNRRPTVRAV